MQALEKRQAGQGRRSDRYRKRGRQVGTKGTGGREERNSRHTWGRKTGR
jgi:hypothetical protein